MNNSDNVRKILLRDWDPFCIGDNPNLKAEYDDFIPEVVALLDSHSDFNTLNAYFKNIEKQTESPTSDEFRARTVKALLSL